MRRSRLTDLFLILATCGLIAAPASALTISGVTVTANAGNTADSTGASDEFLSTMTVLDAGGSVADLLGNQVTAGTQYSSITANDLGGNGSNSYGTTSDYNVTFTVDGEGAATYDITIDTSRIGAFTTANDGGGGGLASASMSAVTGVSSVGGGTGSLDLAALAGVSGGGDQDSPFNQAGVYTLTGLSGVTVVSLDFTWTSSTLSEQHEAAIRMGMTGTLGALTADDYPGVGARAIGGDGHFVDITATVTAVPEPATAVLLSLGLIGLTVSGRRREQH